MVGLQVAALGLKTKASQIEQQGSSQQQRVACDSHHFANARVMV